MHGRELFLDHLALLERILACVGRRLGARDEAEDFASWAKLRLIENDYAILAKFEGRASFGTFLHTVVVNLARDYRISRWGKWRPSAAAKRLGTLAVELETALVRDGLALEEAVSTIIGRHSETDRDELETLAAQLPERMPRRFEGEETIEHLPAPNDRPDHGLVAESNRAVLARAEAALAQSIGKLDAEDRYILALRFREGFTVARIAPLLGIRQRLLYSRLEKLLHGLRHELESCGVTAAEVAEVLGWEESVLHVDFRLPDPIHEPEAAESPLAQPSH